jgi:hypothetical protein
LEVESAKLKESLHISEELWLRDLIDARREVMRREEALKRLDREQKLEREHADNVLQFTRQNIGRLQNEADKYAPGSQLELKRINQIKDLDSKVADAESREKNLEGERVARRIEARLALITAEEKLKVLQRRQARERQQIETDLDEVQEQMRQARTPSRRPDGQDRKTELERKMDCLLREVEELRREVHSQEKKPGP